MANYKTCRTCGAPLHDDDIAIYRKLVYRGAEDFLCIQCLADYFKCSLSFMLGQEECNSLPSPKTELPAFSDRLRELIEAKELKFFLMKKSRLKKDFPSMYNWLSGKYIPNVYNLVRLAKLLDCSVDYLLGRE